MSDIRTTFTEKQTKNLTALYFKFLSKVLAKQDFTEVNNSPMGAYSLMSELDEKNCYKICRALAHHSNSTPRIILHQVVLKKIFQKRLHKFLNNQVIKISGS